MRAVRGPSAQKLLILPIRYIVFIEVQIVFEPSVNVVPDFFRLRPSPDDDDLKPAAGPVAKIADFDIV